MPDNKITIDAENESEINSAQNTSVISYKIDDKLYFCSDSDIKTDRQMIAAAVECEIEATGVNGESFSSYLRFAFSNNDLIERPYLVFSNTTFFSILYKDHGYARLDFEQSYTNLDQGIAKITRFTDGEGFEVDGKLTIISYDPDTRHLEARFSFEQEIEFTNISSEGLVKGPYKRNLKVEDGRLSVTL